MGDKALQLIGEFLTRHSRTQDALFRYGGEEFLISMPRTDLRRAKKILERTRNSISKIAIPTHQEDIHVTVSICCSELLTGLTLKESIERADEALYQAKESGRNRVVGARS
ncbi:MAG: GGDEF domain-containing protein [Gammaproteobacteria bacterium]